MNSAAIGHWLAERLRNGPPLLLDGATGSELERRGVPMDDAAWSGAAVHTHPDVVREVHADYIRAGAEVVITNTFATARHALVPAGLDGETAAINRRAVALAREARDVVAAERGDDRPVAIAGSISTFVFGDRPPDHDTMARDFAEQAELLAGAGVDLFAMEMISDIDHGTLAVQAAAATGLPVWVGFSCRRARDGDRHGDAAGGLVTLGSGAANALPLDTVVPAVLAELRSGGADAAGIMHSQVPLVAPGLHIVRQHWTGPLIAYPHQGRFVMPNWIFETSLDPQAYATAAAAWASHGVTAIGACCGMGPDYVAALKAALAA
ncbi:MAG: homocysteine S-methyltransferase family protein [Alphaproteobacteria bacterium]